MTSELARLAFTASAACTLAAAAGAQLAAPLAPHPLVEIANLGLAADGIGSFDPSLPEGPLVPFFVRELEQEQDLTGDGDLADQVLHVYDGRTRRTTSMARNSSSTLFAVAGEHVVFPVAESDHGDLNGDGDTLDRVLHAWNAATQSLTDLGLASTTFGTVGERLWALVPEPSQGVDLNGDGDAVDSVLHVHDFAASWTRNLALAAAVGEPSLALLPFVVDEVAQSADLDGDGAIGGEVLFALELATGRVLPTGARPAPAQGFSVPRVRAVGARLSFLVSEEAAQDDLNADGDLDDLVHHVWAKTSGVAHLGVAGVAPASGTDVHLFLVVPESKQGADANGDGDRADFVLHVLPAEGPVRSTGLACADPLLVPRPLAGDRLVVVVPEAAQGGLDLNGDGDALDGVFHVYDPALGAGRSLGLARAEPPTAPILAFDGRSAVLAVSEAAQGFVDLDGDGDVFDIVPHLLDVAAGTVASLGMQGRSAAIGRANALALGADLLAVAVSEGGTVDLNGDGDGFDEVPHVLVPAGTFSFRRALASTGGRALLRVLPQGVAFLVDEAAERQDLNGDGDLADRVMHVARLGVRLR